MDGITKSMNMSFEQSPGDSEGQGSLVLQFMGSQRAGHNLATVQQQQLKLCFMTQSFDVVCYSRLVAETSMKQAL